jgi:hypothetical protein
MGEFPMVLEIEMTVEEAENKIGIGESGHCEPGDRSPVPDPVIIDRFGNNRACNSMREGIHKFMITPKLMFHHRDTPWKKDHFIKGTCNVPLQKATGAF